MLKIVSVKHLKKKRRQKEVTNKEGDEHIMTMDITIH